MRRFQFIVCITCFLLLLTACQSTIPTPLVAVLPTDYVADTGPDMPILAAVDEITSGDFEPAECSFRGNQDASSFECGILTVPEDPKFPDGNKLSLPVTIIKADETTAKKEPIVFINNGSSSQFRGYYQYDDQEFLAGRDLVFIEMRGLGATEPNLSCPNISAGKLAAISKPSLKPEDIQSLHQACRDSLQAIANLNAYTYDLNARDLVALRQAMGYPRWIIYSSRYGTPIAMKAAELDPEGVYSIILFDAVPAQPNLMEQATAAQSAINQVFQGCEKHDRCKEMFPNAEEVFYDVVGRLDANPQLVTTHNLSTGDGYEVLVDGNRLIDMVLTFLDTQEDQVGKLPQLVYQLKEGKVEALTTLLSYYVQSIRGNYDGLLALERCFEYPLYTESQIIQATGSLPIDLASYFENQFLSERAICETWSDESRTKPTPYNPTLLRAPVLLITGERSWTIPRSWTDQLAEVLPDVTTVIVPGVGLSGSQSRLWTDCTTQIIASFIANPEENINTQCLLAEKEVIWITLP
jgi:pimeloyl-ACP methyl ester carboxylesterase